MEVFAVIVLVMFVIGLLIAPAPIPTQISASRNSFQGELRRKFIEDGWVNANCSF